MRRPKVIKAKVYRYDPEVDSRPRFESYNIPFQEGMSVTNILEYIYENLDHSLAFFTLCKRGTCGRCLLNINGKNVLACLTEVKGDLEVRPLKKRKVIRDLRMEGI